MGGERGREGEGEGGLGGGAFGGGRRRGGKGGGLFLFPFWGEGKLQKLAEQFVIADMVAFFVLIFFFWFPFS